MRFSPEIIVVQLQTLDGHVQFLETPLHEILQLGVADIQDNPVGRRKLVLKNTVQVSKRAYLVTHHRSGQGVVLLLAGARLDLLPDGALLGTDGEPHQSHHDRGHGGKWKKSTCTGLSSFEHNSAIATFAHNHHHELSTTELS